MPKRPLTSVSVGWQKIVRRSAGSNMFFAVQEGGIVGRNLVWERLLQGRMVFEQVLRIRYDLMVEWFRHLLHNHAPFDMTRRLQYTFQTMLLYGVRRPLQWVWVSGYGYEWTNLTSANTQGELFPGNVLWMASDRNPTTDARIVRTIIPDPDEFAWWNSRR